MGPGINNLVVFFTLGNQAVQVLLLIFLDHDLGLGDKPFLGVGDHKVVLAEGNAGHAGIMEANTHQVVGENHRHFLARVAVDLVDDGGDFLLGQQPVDQTEGDVLVAR